MLYFTVILISMLIIYGYTIPISVFTGFISLKEALIGPMFVNAYVLVVLGLVTLFLRVFVPNKSWNAGQKFFKVQEKEISFYEKIKIKKWKDKVPEMGSTGGFPKRNILSLSIEYLAKFLRETCIAENLHVLSIVFSFTALFFISTKGLIYAVPVLIVNMILHILPCFIQRYVRFKMIKIYNHQLLKQNN